MMIQHCCATIQTLSQPSPYPLSSCSENLTDLVQFVTEEHMAFDRVNTTMALYTIAHKRHATLQALRANEPGSLEMEEVWYAQYVLPAVLLLNKQALTLVSGGMDLGKLIFIFMWVIVWFCVVFLVRLICIPPAGTGCCPDWGSMAAKRTRHLNLWVACHSSLLLAI